MRSDFNCGDLVLMVEIVTGLPEDSSVAYCSLLPFRDADHYYVAQTWSFVQLISDLTN